MARHTEIILDGTKYKVPTLTLDQLERIAEVQSEIESSVPTGKAKAIFTILKIIVEEIEPKIDGSIRASMDEINDTISKVIGGSGVASTVKNPPTAVPAAR